MKPKMKPQKMWTKAQLRADAKKIAARIQSMWIDGFAKGHSAGYDDAVEDLEDK